MVCGAQEFLFLTYALTIRRNGMLIERVLLEPAFQEVFGEKTLVYCAEEANGKCFVMPQMSDEIHGSRLAKGLLEPGNKQVLRNGH